jgi:hypothetical protein
MELNNIIIMLMMLLFSLIPIIMIIYKYWYKSKKIKNKENLENENGDLDNIANELAGNLTNELQQNLFTIVDTIKKIQIVIDNLKNTIDQATSKIPEITEKINKIASQGEDFFESIPNLIMDEIKKILLSASKGFTNVMVTILPEFLKILFNIIYKFIKEVYKLAVEVDYRVQYLLWGIIGFYLMPLFPIFSLIISLLSSFIPQKILLPLLITSGILIYYNIETILSFIFSKSVDLLLSINWTKIIKNSSSILIDGYKEFI